MEQSKSNYFAELYSVNVGDKTEDKGGLTYLSWAWAWGELKKRHPDANYTVYERQTEYGPVNYFTDGRTCWVKTGVTVNGIEHIEELPVMNARNQSLPLEIVQSTDVNKSIQRSLTKAVARHGLGLYIYAGEDLPEEQEDASGDQSVEEKKSAPAPKAARTAPTAAKATPAADSSTDARKPLQTLISEIAGKVKELIGKNKKPIYDKIVEEVTGNAKFRCNSATEEQYDQVLAIHDRLMALKGDE